MISVEEYNKALEVIASYRKQEGEKLEQIKQERLQRMLEKKEWCETEVIIIYQMVNILLVMLKLVKIADIK